MLPIFTVTAQRVATAPVGSSRPVSGAVGPGTRSVVVVVSGTVVAVSSASSPLRNMSTPPTTRAITASTPAPAITWVRRLIPFRGVTTATFAPAPTAVGDGRTASGQSPQMRSALPPTMASRSASLNPSKSSSTTDWDFGHDDTGCG